MIAPILFVLQAATAATPVEGKLQLICAGAGSANKSDTRSVYGGDNAGNTGWATVEGKKSVGFEDQVDLWIQNAEGRIRMPRTMLPKIRGGDDGWFKLRDVKVGDDRITASVAVNLINNPKLLVDRRTGSISIDGKAGHYAGRCQRYDPASQERQF